MKHAKIEFVASVRNNIIIFCRLEFSFLSTDPKRSSSLTLVWLQIPLTLLSSSSSATYFPLLVTFTREKTSETWGSRPQMISSLLLFTAQHGSSEVSSRQMICVNFNFLSINMFVCAHCRSVWLLSEKMERFSQGEAVLLGYNSLRRSFTNSSSSPKAPADRELNLDFHDVFGGPPKRSSVQENGFSFNEATDFLHRLRGEEDEAVSCPVIGGKPVFGDENENRRRCLSNDFFDDIFRGDESLSPARALPPKADPFRFWFYSDDALNLAICRI